MTRDLINASFKRGFDRTALEHGVRRDGQKRALISVGSNAEKTPHRRDVAVTAHGFTSTGAVVAGALGLISRGIALSSAANCARNGSGPSCGFIARN